MQKQKFNYTHQANALMPYVPLKLARDRFLVQTHALVDSGAEINVLPYQLGIDLGFIWDNRKACMSLGGALSEVQAIPIVVAGFIDKLDPVTLAFAWASSDTRLILGQTNFFSLYHICFFQDLGYFEINTK